jgi:hypothetical protein
MDQRDGCKSTATEDGFHVVSIGVENESRVIPIEARARRSIVSSTGVEGSHIKRFDLGFARGGKGGVLFDGMRMKAIDPEHRVVDTVADAVRAHAVRYLHHAAQTKGTESSVIEAGRTGDMRNSDSCVVDHWILLYQLPASLAPLRRSGMIALNRTK